MEGKRRNGGGGGGGRGSRAFAEFAGLIFDAFMVGAPPLARIYFLLFGKTVAPSTLQSKSVLMVNVQVVSWKEEHGYQLAK